MGPALFCEDPAPRSQVLTLPTPPLSRQPKVKKTIFCHTPMLSLPRAMAQNVKARPAITKGILPELGFQSHPSYEVFPNKIKTTEHT